MSRRTRSRQAAIQVLFQDDFNPDHSRDQDRLYLHQQLEGDLELIDLAWLVVDGTRQKKEMLDDLIDKAAENWNLNRILAIDRNIMRIAIYETKFERTPFAVAIDEAVRAAKKFGSKESPAFVNGVLDRLLGAGTSKPLQEKIEDPTPTTIGADQKYPHPKSPLGGLRKKLAGKKTTAIQPPTQSVEEQTVTPLPASVPEHRDSSDPPPLD